MCTSFVSNRAKTVVGWNLDLLDWEYRVCPDDSGVRIEILDPKEGWLPLFGANARGDFVGMPTCWPFDQRSDPKADEPNLIRLDADLLLGNRTLEEIRAIAESGPVCSVPGVTFMASLSDAGGNVLQIVPGQGSLYFERPRYRILTNFSPFKGNREEHPWMGWDRYETAERMLEQASDDFSAEDAFAVLRAVSQTVCPTVVSMVYDVTDRTVFWCENRQWDQIRSRSFPGREPGPQPGSA